MANKKKVSEIHSAMIGGRRVAFRLGEYGKETHNVIYARPEGSAHAFSTRVRINQDGAIQLAESFARAKLEAPRGEVDENNTHPLPCSAVKMVEAMRMYRDHLRSKGSQTDRHYDRTLEALRSAVGSKFDTLSVAGFTEHHFEAMVDVLSGDRGRYGNQPLALSTIALLVNWMRMARAYPYRTHRINRRVGEELHPVPFMREPTVIRFSERTIRNQLKRADNLRRREAPEDFEARAYRHRASPYLEPEQFGRLMSALDLDKLGDAVTFRFLLIGANTAARTSHAVQTDWRPNGPQVEINLHGIDGLHAVMLEPDEFETASNKERPMVRVGEGFASWLHVWNSKRPLHDVRPGGHLGVNTLGNCLIRAARRAGVASPNGQPLSSRVMRYSIATWLNKTLPNGLQNKDARALMGHELGITATHYAEWNASTQKDVVDAIGAYLEEAQRHSNSVHFLDAGMVAKTALAA